MAILSADVQEHHLDVFYAIADGFLHETSPSLLRPYVVDTFTDDQLVEYTKTVTRPSENPDFREYIKVSLARQPTSACQLFVLVTLALLLKLLAPALTGLTTLVAEMTPAQKEKLLLSWRDLPIAAKNRLFTLFARLTMLAFAFTAPPLHFGAIGYPQTDARDILNELYERNDYEYRMKTPPEGVWDAPYDAVIIGLGSGAGVVAHTLARDGHRVLVIEKGQYFRPEDLAFNDNDGYKNLYEHGGALLTADSLMIVLAGATFGGGSTVNWLACLKTPFKVRKEWWENHGLDFFASEQYDADMDYVLQQMGASLDNVDHSFTNATLLAGSEKLGYKHKPIAQNSGGKAHACGFCHLGCKWGIKQGAQVNWLRDAAEHGAEFMDRVRVDRILHDTKLKIATGLECTDLRTGRQFVVRGPRKFVVSAGLLNTPVVLQKLGFRNKHIGRNLKLHPVTSVMAVWAGAKTDPFHKPIMTSICTEAEDLDGKFHGAKIETILHTPSIEAGFWPWLLSDQARQDLVKYQLTAAFLILSRDTSSGSVTYDPKKPDALILDYVINKTDRRHIAQALLVAMDVAYIEGATEIAFPYWKAGRFYSSRRKEARTIGDEDYQAYRKRCADLELTSFGTSYGSAHQMSSCRMSAKGPSDGACDVRGRLYECDNVYVADASAMPTASGANPMVTTMAIARHVARHICDDMRRGARL